jgi:hypothetical protein
LAAGVENGEGAREKGVTSQVDIVLILAVYIFVNKFLDLFTSLLTLPVVNKSFNKFNGLSRENHFERFERLHRFERFKKIYLTRRSIESFRMFNRVVQNVQDETSEPIIRAL